MWRCLKCGYWNEGDKPKHCKNCGEISTAKSWTCEDCKSTNHIDASYCKFCGKPKTELIKKEEETKKEKKDLRPRLFICHASDDKKFVQKLYSDLKVSGIKVWIDSWEIKPGESLVEKIQKGIEESDRMAIVLSPEAVKSGWVKKELHASIIRELEDTLSFIIPIYLKTCEIPLLIRDKKYADFRYDYNKGYRELESALKSISKDISVIKKKIYEEKKGVLTKGKKVSDSAKAKKWEIKKVAREGRVVAKDLPSDTNKIPSWIVLLSQGKLPDDLVNLGWKADDLLEVYSYRLFSEILKLDCVLWGQQNTLFKSFCDGYFVVPNTNKACLFDTKAYSKGYNASKEILKSANNVNEHKADMFAEKTLEAKYFLIISSGFLGKKESQAGKFYKHCGAKLKLCKAQELSKFTTELRKLSTKTSFFLSVAWDEMLSSNGPCLTQETFDDEIKRLKERKELY